MDYKVKLQLVAEEGGGLQVQESTILGSFDDENPARNFYDMTARLGSEAMGTFGDALQWLRAGYKVCRPHWDTLLYWDMTEVPLRLRAVHITGVIGNGSVLPSLDNLFATDWTIYQEEEVNV